MIKQRYFLIIFVMHVLLAMIFPAYAESDGDYPAMQLLLDTQRTIADEVIKYPQAGQAKITASIITIAPGTSTGWHRHNVHLVGYLMSGELEMEYANGKRVTLGKGDALAEAMSVAHIGSNPGKEPAQILVVFIGTDALAATQGVEAPATPPHKPDANAKVDLVNLAQFDRRLQMDLRYASANNFMSKPLYPVARALLQRPAAEALMKAHDSLRATGYGLVILDAYRPWQVTREMWDKHPSHRAYLADPP